jgi:hypothetical protein
MPEDEAHREPGLPVEQVHRVEARFNGGEFVSCGSKPLRHR